MCPVRLLHFGLIPLFLSLFTFIAGIALSGPLSGRLFTRESISNMTVLITKLAQISIWDLFLIDVIYQATKTYAEANLLPKLAHECPSSNVQSAAYYAL